MRAPNTTTYCTRRMAAVLACSIPSDASEIPDMIMAPSATFAIETHLVNPCASEFALSRVPPVVHSDRPLEVEMTAIRQSADAGAAESVASWISAHALLQISVEVPGNPQGEVPVFVKARPSKGGWIVRVLVRPGAWADAASVTLHSISLAGQPLSCDCLPATLRVGYNHAPAPEGAVYAAGKAGDVPALQVALVAGGSTEEADTVREGERGDPWGAMERSGQDSPLQPPPSPLLCCRTAALLSLGPPLVATSRLSARSFWQAPTRRQQTR